MPRRYPASIPSVSGSRMPPVAIVASVTMTVVRIAQIVRLSRSRPLRSVPSGCSTDGPWNEMSRFCSA